MKKLIIASTSTIHGSGYLEYLLPTLTTFFANVKTILFIPYARPGGISYNEYTDIAKKAFATINIEVNSKNIIDDLKQVLENGTPYLGTSAGSNICGVNMKNTNDMPIVYPPSFTTLGIIPFNINAHYLDPIQGSTHMGETRETRIKEFHVFNKVPVLGLRQGSWLQVLGNVISLEGTHTARLFKQNLEAIELEKGSLKWEV